VRIAWLSPAAGNSGIVEFTRALLPALARHAEPELWAHGRPEAPPPDIPVVDYSADPLQLERLVHYDAVFYNLGNHLGFHRAEYESSLVCPGIVVLHDRSLHHFFAGYHITHRGLPNAYIERMAALYGPRGREVADAVVAERGEAAWDDEEEVLEHAFIEDALVNAVGAVVHARGHAEVVRARWAGPVRALDMPAYPSHLRRHPAAFGECGDVLTLVSIGHVGPSKHIHAAVEALAGAPDLSSRVRYLVAGPYDPRSSYIRDLSRIIADHGLARVVQLLGYVPPRMLDKLAARADIFLNLRLPNLEGGSASLMQQLAYGRPIVTYASGVYAELPDDVVAKITPGDRGELARCLLRLVDDPGLRRRLGEAARALAERRDIDAYAQGLVEFARVVDTWRPALRLADRVGTELLALGASETSPDTDDIGEMILDLLVVDAPSPQGPRA